MNCGDINDELIRGALSREAEDHLRSCDRCRELANALSRADSAEAPSPAILQDIETQLRSDLRPVRPIAAKRYFFAAIFAIYVFVVAAGVYFIGAFARMDPIQAATILGMLAISSGLLAYSLVHQMVPGSRHRLAPAVLPIGIVVLLAIAVAVLFQFHDEEYFWLKNWGCIRAGSPIAVLATLPLWVVLRRGAILSARVAGAATGLLAGLAGTTALEIHCPNLEAAHILVSHVGVAALGLMVGTAVGLIVDNRTRTP